MASQMTVTGEELNARPVTRPGEILEAVPGLIVTQHSGEGKANQYFLRGYNLDHGTDLAIWVDDVPINMRTHAHGQGYADLNWLMPETVNSLEIRKGPYFADEGDFGSAGNLHIGLIDSVNKSIAEMTVGSFGYERIFGMGSTKMGDGTLLFAGEAGAYNGPWVNPDDMRKINSLLRYSQGTAQDGLSITGMAYSNKWNSTDQVPQRAITSGQIGLYGEEDPTDGGNTDRFALSARMAGTDDAGSWKANAYVVKSDLDLFNNFTYFLTNPAQGDQFHQHDSRVMTGANASRTLNGSFAGRLMETTFGVQTRYDDIDLGLTDTFQRSFLSNVRSDKVRGSERRSLCPEHRALDRLVAGPPWDGAATTIPPTSIPCSMPTIPARSVPGSAVPNSPWWWVRSTRRNFSSAPVTACTATMRAAPPSPKSRSTGLQIRPRFLRHSALRRCWSEPRVRRSASAPRSFRDLIPRSACSSSTRRPRSCSRRCGRHLGQPAQPALRGRVDQQVSARIPG